MSDTQESPTFSDNYSELTNTPTSDQQEQQHQQQPQTSQLQRQEQPTQHTPTARWETDKLDSAANIDDLHIVLMTYT
eukprot:Pgem_evm1s15955